MEVYEVRVCEDRVEWYHNGKFHRLDGPAIEFADGYKAWHQNGKLHRIDGPAIEWADGTKHWYQNGELHRLDGPAREWADDGTKEYWIEGEELTEKDFLLEPNPASVRK